MNYKHHMTVFAAIIMIIFTAGAQEVYKSVDKKGVVEFSDQPGPGAKAVDVKPNIVDVAPVEPRESSPPVSATSAEKSGSKVQPEVIREYETGGYYGERRQERRERERRERERRARMEHRQESVQVPAHKPVQLPHKKAGTAGVRGGAGQR